MFLTPQNGTSVYKPDNRHNFALLECCTHILHDWEKFLSIPFEKRTPFHIMNHTDRANNSIRNFLWRSFPTPGLP